jgi:Protein of unknown function (DUF483)
VHSLVFANRADGQCWLPQIKAIASAWYEIEVSSVADGLRDGALLRIPQEDFQRRQATFTQAGLFVRILHSVGETCGFSHREGPVQSGQKHTFLTAITRSADHAQAMFHALRDSDHVSIGQLLGYPSCCVQSFAAAWLTGISDPVWQMAEHSVERNRGRRINQNQIIVDSFSAINPVLRYIGVRLLAHIPCSFTCEESLRLSERWIDLVKHHYSEEMAQGVLALLASPVEWKLLGSVTYVRNEIVSFDLGSQDPPSSAEIPRTVTLKPV